MSIHTLAAVLRVVRNPPCFMACLTVCLLGVIQINAANFYAAPGNSRGGTGARDNPWDLQTALDHPPAVNPGDTIWLRGGTYRMNGRPARFASRLSGAPERPIIVRQFPGERAIIDSSLQHFSGGWVHYYDFEISSSQTNRLTGEKGPFPRAWWEDRNGKEVDFCVSGLDLRAPDIKAINLIIHDALGGGIAVNKSAADTEIYGCLTYYNGWQGGDRGHGHGIYGQNSAPNLKLIKDNLFFANLALGVHVTGTGSEAGVDNFIFDGNACFMNGILAREHQANFLAGAWRGRGRNLRVLRNFIYDIKTAQGDSNIGYGGGYDGMIVRDNYFATRALFSAANVNIDVSGNIFLDGATGLDRSAHGANTFQSPARSRNHIVVRPNKYEKGRAHVIVYNWENLGRVTVNIFNCGLENGDAYELHNAADYFGDIATGVYKGDPIVIQMTNHTVAMPVGANFKRPPSTFPKFGVFVLMKVPTKPDIPAP